MEGRGRRVEVARVAAAHRGDEAGPARVRSRVHQAVALAHAGAREFELAEAVVPAAAAGRKEGQAGGWGSEGGAKEEGSRQGQSRRDTGESGVRK